ncbi:MAG: hypothetical protein KA717_36290 [Woronichinia naegeliana WA131]|uniref:Uncharacterized protein n=1 Tax=Woronichinia naegeliana WA131 TaxID=2824559 RepID=A0A977KXP4_9CYAN|nr:MAG: hypothetical protein KA717_36290 [Woronichinia naegeliana WA131]
MVLRHSTLFSCILAVLNSPTIFSVKVSAFFSKPYVAKAIARGEKPDTVTYLAERAKLFGLVKAERKRHREKAALNQQIWEPIQGKRILSE